MRAVLLVTASRDSSVCWQSSVCVASQLQAGMSLCLRDTELSHSHPLLFSSEPFLSATPLSKAGHIETSPALFCTGLQATLNNHPKKIGKVSS